MYYGGAYRLEYRCAATPSLRHVYRNARAACERLPWLLRAVPSPGSVLDVGCGSGEFVRLLTRLGYAAVGLEPDPSYASYARDSFHVPVVNGFLEEAPLPEGGFSCVTGFHVIEHVLDPPAFLLALRRLVRAGGRLVLETPDAESPFPHGTRRFHRAHLHYFSLETLCHCAATGGWRVLESGRSWDGGNLFLVAEADEPASSAFSKPLGPAALLRHSAAMRAAAYFGSPYFLPRLARQIAFRVRERMAAVASTEPEQVLLRAIRMSAGIPPFAEAGS